MASTASPAPRSAWLDGLRGYAALLVFICHFTFVFWPQGRFAYGTMLPLHSVVPNSTYIDWGEPVWNGTRVTQLRPYENTNLIQLPIVRLLLDGDSMVVLFFIVSGYSLSIKPLSLMRQGPSGHAQLLPSLSSMVLRRPIRLLLPILASSLMVMVATRLSLYTYASIFASDPATFHRYFKGWAFEATPKILPSLYEQIVDWCYSMYDLLDFFTHFHWTMSRYDIHLWTIPVELRCSLILFLTQLGTGTMDSRSRLITLGTLFIGAMTWGDTWELALFWAGMLLCEIDLLYPPSDPPSHRESPAPSLSYTFNLISGLCLLSTPLGWAWASPLYAPLTYYSIPGLRASDQSRLWQCIGAVQVMVSVARCKTFRDFFSNGPARYLGRISFALYLVHGPITRSLGYSLVFKLWQIMGRETAVQYNVAVFVTALIVFHAVFAAANLFCRRVDEPVVRLARWIDQELKNDGDAKGIRVHRAKTRSVDILPTTRE